MPQRILMADGTYCTRPGVCSRHNGVTVAAGVTREQFIAEARRTRTPERWLTIAREPLPEITQPLYAPDIDYLGEYDGFEIEREYDYYYTPDYYSQDEGDGVVSAYVAGLNKREVLGKIFGVPSQDVPADLLAYADELGMLRPSAWQANLEHDYYGNSSINVELADPSQLEALKAWYIKQPYATDREGLRDALRSIGYDAAPGDNAVAVIQQALAKADLPPRAREKLAGATHIALHRKSFDYLYGTARRQASVRMRKPYGGTDNHLSGIVYQNAGGAAIILDGKGHIEQRQASGKRWEGRFIVLSND